MPEKGKIKPSSSFLIRWCDSLSRGNDLAILRFCFSHAARCFLLKVFAISFPEIPFFVLRRSRFFLTSKQVDKFIAKRYSQGFCLRFTPSGDVEILSYHVRSYIKSAQGGGTGLAKYARRRATPPIRSATFFLFVPLHPGRTRTTRVISFLIKSLYLETAEVLLNKPCVVIIN